MQKKPIVHLIKTFVFFKYCCVWPVCHVITI